jgi:hypothetical protein
MTFTITSLPVLQTLLGADSRVEEVRNPKADERLSLRQSKECPLADRRQP